jgi:hypothetical protein
LSVLGVAPFDPHSFLAPNLAGGWRPPDYP